MTTETHEYWKDPRNATVLVYVNGELAPRSEAKVSVFDSGFILGDGVGEGLRLHHDKLAFPDQHLDRLFEGATATADEALMPDPHGFVTMCNSANFLILRKGEVCTSRGRYCLNSVTRSNANSLCRENRVPVFEKDFSLTDVCGAGEALITGAFEGFVPAVEVDEQTIGDGVAEPGTLSLRQLYSTLLDGECPPSGAGS